MVEIMTKLEEKIILKKQGKE